jgi:predicted transcriptional regulator
MTATTPERSGLQVLKDRRGALSKELLDRVRTQNAAKTAIRKALKAGPLTVPEIAQAAAIPARDVLWYVTAMRKYGQVVEEGQDGDYIRYGLAAEAPR